MKHKYNSINYNTFVKLIRLSTQNHSGYAIGHRLSLRNNNILNVAQGENPLDMAG